MNLLKKQCDVILCGRASDTALFSALPLMRGFLAGPVWHCAKTIECGAICSTSTRADGVFAEIDDNGFSVEPLALDASCTPLSLASHTLYENADPYLIREPSGILDTQNARYQKLSERKSRVEGSVFRPDRYTLKLEGTTCTGFQTVAIGGVRDPYIIARVSWLAEMKVFFAERLKELTGKTLGKEVYLNMVAVMGELEKSSAQIPNEIGLLFCVTAPEQALANLPDSLPKHWPIPDVIFISGIAFFFSTGNRPGTSLSFRLNHVLFRNHHYPLSVLKWRTSDERASPSGRISKIDSLKKRGAVLDNLRHHFCQ